MANQLLRKTGLYLIGNLASKVTVALIIPIYAFFVQPDSLGVFDYDQTLMLVLTPLAFFALWESILRFAINEGDERKLTEVVTTSVIMSCGSLLFVILLAVLIWSSLPYARPYVLDVALMASAYGMAQVWQYLARGLRRPSEFVRSGVLAALVNFAGILILVCGLNMQLSGLVVSYVAGQLAVVVFLESRLRILKRLSFADLDSALAKRMLVFSAPLAINLILISLITGFGRILITALLGPEQNGLYSFAMKFGGVVTAFGSIFSMAVVEEAILRIGKSEADSFFRKVVRNTTELLIALSLIALPVISLFFLLIANTEYYPAFSLVPAFLVYAVATVLSTVVGSVFQTVEKTEQIALTSFLGTIATVVISVFTIGRIGTLGVAWGLAAGSIVMLVLRYQFARRHVSGLSLGLSNWLLIALLLACSALYLLFGSSWGLGGNSVWLIVTCTLSLPVFIKALRGLRGIPDAV